MITILVQFNYLTVLVFDQNLIIRAIFKIISEMF